MQGVLLRSEGFVFSNHDARRSVFAKVPARSPSAHIHDEAEADAVRWATARGSETTQQTQAGSLLLLLLLRFRRRR